LALVLALALAELMLALFRNGGLTRKVGHAGAVSN